MCPDIHCVKIALEGSMFLSAYVVLHTTHDAITRVPCTQQDNRDL